MHSNCSNYKHNNHIFKLSQKGLKNCIWKLKEEKKDNLIIAFNN